MYSVFNIENYIYIDVNVKTFSQHLDPLTRDQKDTLLKIIVDTREQKKRGEF